MQWRAVGKYWGSALEARTRGSNSVVVHPGFVRTATSTLQERVFAQHPEVHFLGLPAPSKELAWAIRHLCNADSLYFDEKRVGEIFARSLADADPGKTAMLSYENYALYESKDKGLIAERVRRLFPSARIAFTIRRQEDLVGSWYLTKLRKHIKGKNFPTFEEWFRIKNREPHRSILDDLRYFTIIEGYASLFGRERIGIFLLEGLKRDPRRFADRLAGFLEVDASIIYGSLTQHVENAAMSQRYLDLWMRFGPFLPKKIVRKLSRLKYEF